MFDFGNEGMPTLNDVASWNWLGPIILDAMRRKDVLVATNCGMLLSPRASGREGVTPVHEILSGFFGENASEVIQILDEIAEQIPEPNRTTVRNVIAAARQPDGKGNIVGVESEEMDANGHST